MRIPFRRHRNDDQPGGVGSTAERYSTSSTTPTQSGGQSRIPDGYPSVLIMQTHPVTGQPGSFVYVHSARAGGVTGSEYEIAEVDPRTGEILRG